MLGADKALGILAVSPSLAAAERRTAHEVAAVIGARLVEVETHELEVAEYAANPVDRCYYCKDQLFTAIDDLVLEEYGLDAVAYGENADDAERVDRPGSRAATEHRVLWPLATAGLTKARVRGLARALGLPVADKPASPCLASRIPHGEPVTVEKLRAIEAAEEAVRLLGFTTAASATTVTWQESSCRPTSCLARANRTHGPGWSRGYWRPASDT